MRREGIGRRESERGREWEWGTERKGRSESEEERQKLGLLAHHSLLITWFVHAAPLTLVLLIGSGGRREREGVKVRKREREIEGELGIEGGRESEREKRVRDRMYYGRLLNKNVLFFMAFPCIQNTTPCSII